MFTTRRLPLSAIVILLAGSSCSDDAKEPTTDADGDGSPAELDCDDTWDAAWDVDVRTGSAGLASQSDVDAFCHGSCPAYVQGTLTVEWDYGLHVGDPISSVETLGCLSGLDGGLRIINNPFLTSLAGLDGVTSVGGDLLIEMNELESIDALGALASVGGDVRIVECDDLRSIDGFDALTSVDGFMEIGGPRLEAIDGFGALETVKGTMYVGPVSTRLSGFTALTSVGTPGIGGGLSIGSCDSLTGVSFPSLTRIGFLVVEDNPALLDLDGLGMLSSIEYTLRIARNDALVDVSGVETISEIGGDVTIEDNTSLATEDAWALVAAIETIGGSVTVTGNGP